MPPCMCSKVKMTTLPWPSEPVIPPSFRAFEPPEEGEEEEFFQKVTMVTRLTPMRHGLQCWGVCFEA